MQSWPALNNEHGHGNHSFLLLTNLFLKSEQGCGLGMAMRHIFPMRIAANQCAFPHIFANICALSASFRICRIRMAIPSVDNLECSSVYISRIVDSFSSCGNLDNILRMWNVSILMPFSTVGRPKVHGGISGGSVFVAVSVGHKITYLTPQCAHVFVTAPWPTLTFCP